MSFLSSVPKEPRDAFRHILTEAQNIVASTPPNHQLNVVQRTKFISMMRSLNAISNRLEYGSDFIEILNETINLIKQGHADKVRTHLVAIEESFLGEAFHHHFLDEEEEASFNQMEWQGDDRNIVIDALSKAKSFVSFSDGFKDGHKRRVLYWISKAESEVFRDKGTYSTIMTAASEVLDLAEKAGEKAKPLARLVEIVRTSTKKNVTINQLEAPEEQKKLPKPDEAAE